MAANMSMWDNCRRDGLCNYANCDCCVIRNGVPKCVDKQGELFCTHASDGASVPVCSLDERTFQSPSALARESCLKNEINGILHAGKCHENGPLLCSTEGLCQYSTCCCHLHNNVPKCLGRGFWYCPNTFGKFAMKEVCANNGKTYPSPKLILMESCIENKPIEISHEGPCNTRSLLRSGPSGKIVNRYDFGLGR